MLHKEMFLATRHAIFAKKTKILPVLECQTGDALPISKISCNAVCKLQEKLPPVIICRREFNNSRPCRVRGTISLMPVYRHQ